MSENLQCHWAREAFTPGQFPERVTLPRVARLMPGDGGESVPPRCLGSAADVKKPFLVYSQRRRTKGYARHMVPDESTGGYVWDGMLIEIPKDYAGFFELVPKDPHKQPVHHASIRAVVEARCERFLVQTVLGGFLTIQISNSELASDDVPSEEVTILQRHLIYPGEVLQPVKTVTKYWRLQGSDSQAETEYLLCRDLNGDELVVPMAHPGTFCALYDPRTSSAHFVWSANELLTRFRLPVMARLMFGWPPQLPAGRRFSGVLRVVEKRRPDTLVLYNFQAQASVVAELPMDMHILLQPAANQREMAKTSAYHVATKRCDRAAFCYVTNMKMVDLDYSHLLWPHQRRLSASAGLMAPALDMWSFNIRDIFPPVAEKEFSASSLPITFHDAMGDNEDDGRIKDSTLQDGGAKGGHLTRSKSMSGINKFRKTASLDDHMTRPDLNPSLADAQRARVEEADNRETRC